jgi:hypothetical protein
MLDIVKQLSLKEQVAAAIPRHDLPIIYSFFSYFNGKLGWNGSLGEQINGSVEDMLALTAPLAIKIPQLVDTSYGPGVVGYSLSVYDSKDFLDRAKTEWNIPRLHFVGHTKLPKGSKVSKVAVLLKGEKEIENFVQHLKPQTKFEIDRTRIVSRVLVTLK